MKDFNIVMKPSNVSCHELCSKYGLKVPFYEEVYALDESKIISECDKFKTCTFLVQSNFDYDYLYWTGRNQELIRGVNWKMGYPNYHDVLRITYKSKNDDYFFDDFDPASMVYGVYNSQSERVKRDYQHMWLMGTEDLGDYYI